jgi:hypothetical protein
MNISNLDDDDSFDDDILLYKHIRKVFFFIQVCVCAVGLLGNLISLSVWIKGQNTRKLACSMYFIFLSASDSFCMLYKLTANVVYNPWRDSYRVATVFECISANTFIYFSPQLSAWTIVCICAERTLSICFPLTFNTKGAGRRAKITFLSLIILLAGMNLSDVTLLCNDFHSNGVRNTIYYINGVYILCVFPLLFITICNVITIVILCKRKSRVVRSSRRHLAKFTRLSIVTGIFHCVCVTPFIVLLLFLTNNIDLNIDFKEHYIFVFVSGLFLYLNNAFSFLLYSLASKDFKQDLKQLLCSCRNRE